MDSAKTKEAAEAKALGNEAFKKASPSHAPALSGRELILFPSLDPQGDLQGALKAYHTVSCLSWGPLHQSSTHSPSLPTQALFLLIGLSRDVGFGGPKPAEGEQRQLASIDKEARL